MPEKTEWLNKLRNVISSKGGQVKGESGPPMRQSLSDGSLVNNSHTPLPSKFLMHLCYFTSFVLFYALNLTYWNYI